MDNKTTSHDYLSDTEYIEYIVSELEWTPEPRQYQHLFLAITNPNIKHIERVFVHHVGTTFSEYYESIIVGSERMYAYTVACLQEDPDVITLHEFNTRMQAYVNNTSVYLEVK